MAQITESQRQFSKESSPKDLRVPHSDWLANLIIASQLVVHASDVITVTHVRWAASAVLFFLESIQVRFVTM